MDDVPIDIGPTRHAICHKAESFGFLQSIPDSGSFPVFRIIVMKACQSAAHLVLAVFVLLHRLWSCDQPIHSTGCRGRFRGEIALHSSEWDKDLADVSTIIAGVLLFILHDANNRVGEVTNADGLPQDLTSSKQLFARITADERHTAGLCQIFPVVKSALLCGQGPNLTESQNSRSCIFYR